MMTTQHATNAEQAAMARALEIATQGPLTGPNPRVGCCILDREGTIVAEGWHRGPGLPHAEIEALNNLRARGLEPAGLTAVVTLEPCAHTGKTGPCADALIEAGIRRVVYAVRDPGATSGGGAQRLQDAGVSIVAGVLEPEGTRMIERWYVATARQRPWVTVKWAMSWDGRAAAQDGTSQWITGALTRSRVHADRSHHDAIVVGSQTALIDNPSLTARTDSGELYTNQPRAVVVGERDVPADALVRSHPGGFQHHKDRDLPSLLSDLFESDARSVYVEGGPTLASAFIREGLVDEFHITVGPLLLGGDQLAIRDLGVESMSGALALAILDVERVGEDVVVTARPRKESS